MHIISVVAFNLSGLALTMWSQTPCQKIRLFNILHMKTTKGRDVSIVAMFFYDFTFGYCFANFRLTTFPQWNRRLHEVKLPDSHYVVDTYDKVHFMFLLEYSFLFSVNILTFNRINCSLLYKLVLFCGFFGMFVSIINICPSFMLFCCSW